MSDVNGTPPKEKAAKIRHKSERESVLQQTFAAARHNTTSNSPWLENQQPGGGFLQRQCACGTHTIAGGECDACRQKRERGSLQRTAVNPISDNLALSTPAEVQTFPKMGFAHDLSQIPTHTIGPRPTVQPKLTLGAAGDHFEGETDRVAKETVSHITLPKSPLDNQRKAIQKKEIAKTTSRQSPVSQPLHQEKPGLQEDLNNIDEVGLIQTQVGAQVVQRTLDVAAAIAYNQNALGGNTQFIRYIKDLLNRATGGRLPMNSVIDEAFVRAVARFQELRRLPRPHDGKVGSRTRRALATDLKGFFIGTGGGAAPRALRAAQNIIDIYTNEKILFAWWAGDFRDNNKNNRVDARDPSERNKGDGWPSSHNRTFRGFKTVPGTYTSPTGMTLTTAAFETDTPVKYKVCADIVSQAYSQAGVMSSTTRAVVRILGHFQASRHCDVWRIGDADFPDTYLPGDFICEADGSHGHAGMVIHEEPTNAGAQTPVVVHLPGSSLQIARGQYDPTRTSDVRLERWPRERWRPAFVYLGRSRR